jgi:hypothetical protein
MVYTLPPLSKPYTTQVEGVSAEPAVANAISSYPLVRRLAAGVDRMAPPASRLSLWSPTSARIMEMSNSALL